MKYLSFTFLIVLGLAVGLIGWASGQTNPVDEAEAFAIESKANSDAAAAAELLRHNNQVHLMDEAKKQWWANLRANITVSANKFANFFIKALYVPAVAFIAGLTVMAFILPYSFGQGGREWVLNRARILPLYKDGTSPTMIVPYNDVPIGEAWPTGWKSWTTAIQYRPNKLMLMDTATGRTQKLDVEHPTNASELEVMRQLRTRWLIVSAQKVSSLTSHKGEVADAMGHSALELDAGSIKDAPEHDDYMREIMTEIKEKMKFDA